VLGRTGWLDERTLAEEVLRHSGRGDGYFLEEGGPQTRSVLAKCLQRRTLNLAWKGLSRLGPEVGDLPDVAQLSLEGNKLSALPEELGDLFSLNLLDLRFNPLRALPAGLARLNQLRELRLSNTGLPVTASGPLFTLTALTRLYVDGCDWGRVPDAIGQLTRLESLQLGDNGLTTLPDSLAQLQRLTFLHLAHNDFGTVPRALFELRALKTLWLEGCKLRELSADLERLQALETLCLWHNALESLPIDALARLPRLKEVRIRDNKLPPGTEAELRAALPRCVIY
jgi:Leucine-rich repeat (LRR) protein